MSTTLKRYDQRHICQLTEINPTRRARELAEQMLNDIGLELTAQLAREELINHVLWLDAHHEEISEEEEEECIEIIQFDHMLIAACVLRCNTEDELMLVHCL